LLSFPPIFAFLRHKPSPHFLPAMCIANDIAIEAAPRNRSTKHGGRSEARSTKQQSQKPKQSRPLFQTGRRPWP
jgi:hypothetical protein